MPKLVRTGGGRMRLHLRELHRGLKPGKGKGRCREAGAHARGDGTRGRRLHCQAFQS